MVPFKLAKMKLALAPLPPLLTWKAAALLLKTWPVGPCGPAAVVGIRTWPLGGLILFFVTLVLPVTLYRVLVLVPWFETQNGLVALCEKPQGFMRSASVIFASP